MPEVLGALERIGPRAPQQLLVAQTLKMFERDGPLAVVVFPEIAISVAMFSSFLVGQLERCDRLQGRTHLVG